MSTKVPPAPPASSSRDEPFIDGLPADGRASSKDGEDRQRQDGSGMLSNHKGKLAVGAAAMLGLAVYYKWREHMLAKEDPDEYRRLRRITASVGTGESQSGRKT